MSDEIKNIMDKDYKDSPEPQVVKQVLEEIHKFGDNVKNNYTELRKSHEQLRQSLDENQVKTDTLIEEKIAKISEDITVRQNEIDKINSKRMDQIEVAMNRLPRGTEVEEKEDKQNAIDFMIDCLSLEDGAPDWKKVKEMKENPDIEGYKNYKDAFINFVRRPGDERSLNPDEFKALSVGSDPDGGYLVTPAMSTRIIKRLYESDPIRQLCSNERITTGALEFLVDWAQAGFGWEGETDAGDETSTPQFNKKRIPAHTIYAKPRATQTLLEDSGINVEVWLANKVADRFLRGEGAAFVNGDGVARPRGFLTYDNGTSFAQIEQTNMGAAAALTADGIYDVKFSLIEQYLTRGTWLMNRTTVAAALKLKDGEGNYLWSPGLREDAFSTLIGLPVRMSTTMPAVAANALSIALADWREAYMIVDRLGITIQRDPYTAKPFVEFYTRKRVGGDVVNFEAIKIGKVSA